MLFELPTEVLFKTLFDASSPLSTTDVGNLAQTCKRGRELFVTSEYGRDLHKSLAGAATCAQNSDWRAARFACARGRWGGEENSPEEVVDMTESSVRYTSKPLGAEGEKMLSLAAKELFQRHPEGDWRYRVGVLGAQCGMAELVKEVVEIYGQDPVARPGGKDSVVEACIWCCQPGVLETIKSIVPDLRLADGVAEGDVLEVLCEGTMGWSTGDDAEVEERLVALVLADPGVDVTLPPIQSDESRLARAAWCGSLPLVKHILGHPDVVVAPDDSSLANAAANKFPNVFKAILQDGRVDPKLSSSGYGDALSGALYEIDGDKDSADAAAAMITALMEDSRYSSPLDSDAAELMEDAIEWLEDEGEDMDPLIAVLTKYIPATTSATEE